MKNMKKNEVEEMKGINEHINPWEELIKVQDKNLALKTELNYYKALVLKITELLKEKEL